MRPFNANFSLKPQTPWTIIPTKGSPTCFLISSSLSQPKKILKTQILALSSSSSSTQTTEENPQDTQELKSSFRNYNVEFRTTGGCKLGISRYPDFEYDAEGGRGSGSGRDGSNGEIMVSFDVGQLYVPPLTSGTAKFLGLPLPPFLRIDIEPEVFQGSIDEKSGKVDLEFKAKFWFSMGNIYKAPPLLVATILTSEESQGQMRKGRGQRKAKDGKCKLVGIATVDPIDDVFMNSFLALPTECLAILNASISLQK